MKNKYSIAGLSLMVIIIILSMTYSCNKKDNEDTNNNQVMHCDTSLIAPLGANTYFKVINSLNSEADIDFTVNNPFIPYSVLMNSSDCHVFVVSSNTDYTIKVSKWNQGQERFYYFNVKYGETWTLTINEEFFN